LHEIADPKAPGYHTWFFFLCHEDHYYAALLSDMHNTHPLLQAAHGLSSQTSARRPVLRIVNSMQGYLRVSHSCTAAKRLLLIVACEYRRRRCLRVEGMRTLNSDTLEIIDVHEAKLAAQEGVDCALSIRSNFHCSLTRTENERR